MALTSPPSPLLTHSLYLSWSAKRPCWASRVRIMVSKNFLSRRRCLNICNCFSAGSSSRSLWNCGFGGERWMEWDGCYLTTQDTILQSAGYLDWFQDNVVIWSRWKKESHCKCLEVSEGIVSILNTDHIMEIGLQFSESWGGNQHVRGRGGVNTLCTEYGQVHISLSYSNPMGIVCQHKVDVVKRMWLGS